MITSKRIITIITIIVLVLFSIITIFSTYYIVGEQENAVVTMFGKIQKVDSAGLYFKIPFLQKVDIVNTSVHSMTIGYKEVNNSYQNIEYESIMITSDFNFVDIDFYLEYKVSDPVSYLYSSTNPLDILKNMTLSAIRNIVIRYDVDSVITTAKQQIQIEVKDFITKLLEKSNIGLQIVNITIQDAEPPTQEIIKAFKDVETAKQGKDTELNRARKYVSEELPKAIARVDSILQNAEAQRVSRIAEAKGQVSRFTSMYNEYKNQPLITKQRLYYETLESILPNIKLYIVDDNTIKILPLESLVK